MTERIYTYTKTYRKKDGTLSTYTYTCKYGHKGKWEWKGKKVIPEEIKKEIIHKWKLGVTKIKLRNEYGLSRWQLDKILSVRSSRNSKVSVDSSSTEFKKDESDKPKLTPLVIPEKTELDKNISPVSFEGGDSDLDSIPSTPTTPKLESSDVLSILVENILEYVTGKKYSELKADYEKRGNLALRIDWSNFPEVRAQYERRRMVCLTNLKSG